MNPHQKNKIDIGSLSADEQRLFRLYGKLPNKKDLLQNKLKERKYFDSGDYALSKAGKAGDSGVTAIGTEHPSADNIPHASPLTHIITRGDSISGASPPSSNGGYLSSPGGHNSNMNSIVAGDGSSPTLAGPSPAGMHRGSINGIPGGGLPSMQTGGIINSRSPVKESYLNRSASIDDHDNEQEMSEEEQNTGGAQGGISPPPKTEGIPIRR